jgi:hypothetical protein
MAAIPHANRFSGKRILLTGRGPWNNIKRPHSFEVAGQVRNGTISAAGVHVNEGQAEPPAFPYGMQWPWRGIGPDWRNTTQIFPLCSLSKVSINEGKKCRPSLIRHAPWPEGGTHWKVNEWPYSELADFFPKKWSRPEGKLQMLNPSNVCDCGRLS